MSNKKKLIVSDSSSLILMAKSDILEIASKLFDIKIPKRVYEESIIEGKKRHRADAFIIEREIQCRRIEVVNVENKDELSAVIRSFNMGDGEKESIALYPQIGADLLLTDDKKAIGISRIFKIRWSNTPNLLPLLIRLNKIKEDEAIYSLAKLQRYGRYQLDYILEIENNVKNIRRRK